MGMHTTDLAHVLDVIGLMLLTISCHCCQAIHDHDTRHCLQAPFHISDLRLRENTLANLIGESLDSIVRLKYG